MSGQYLSKDLLRDHLASVSIKVLEEALAVESVLFNDLLESENDIVNDSALFLGGFSATIVGAGSSVIYYSVDLLFETFLSEDLFNVIAEFSPFNVFAFFRCFEFGGQKTELGCADRNLSHIEGDSELSVRNETGSQLVKVSKELFNTDTSLLADGADASDNII